MEIWGEEHTHAQLTRQCLRCARLQGAGWVPMTLLYEGVRVGSPQHRGLPFFLPDCFLLLLCHLSLSLISSPWKSLAKLYMIYLFHFIL